MKSITVNHRHKIIKLAEKLGYEINELEFRTDGIRYDYWKDCTELAEKINETILPCDIFEMFDSDCGDQYYIRYMEHYDKDFPSSTHCIRYEEHIPFPQYAKHQEYKLTIY